MSELKVNKISPQSGTAFTIGDSGDTFTVPSGATLTVAGTFTQTGAQTFDGGVDIDNFNINGTTIALSSGNMTIDAQGNDTDIIFKGTDGSADTTFLTIDGSAAGAATFNDKIIATELDISGNCDIDGTTNLDAVDIDGAVQLDATLTIGANDQGYDVILYGDTASANVTWDTSADDLIFNGAAGLIVPDGQLTLGSTAVTATAAELNLIDGGTSRGTTAIADGDGVLINDAGTMRQTTVETLKTYIGGNPITSVSQFRLTTTFTGDAAPIASNLEEVDTYGYGRIGTAVSQSSGVFTFPSTGVWLVSGQASFQTESGQSDNFKKLIIQTTTDNSSYNSAARGWNGAIDATEYSSCAAEFLFDVTNTSNCKVQFAIDVNNNSSYTLGNTNTNDTFFTFIRLGDT